MSKTLTSILVEDEMHFRTTVEILNVIKSPSGEIVPAEGNINGLFRTYTKCYCGHKQKGEAKSKWKTTHSHSHRTKQTLRGRFYL